MIDWYRQFIDEARAQLDGGRYSAAQVSATLALAVALFECSEGLKAIAANTGDTGDKVEALSSIARSIDLHG